MIKVDKLKPGSAALCSVKCFIRVLSLKNSLALVVARKNDTKNSMEAAFFNTYKGNQNIYVQ